MAITNTDLNELLAAIRAGGDIDVVRRGVELMLPALIDAEANAQNGAHNRAARAPQTLPAKGESSLVLIEEFSGPWFRFEVRVRRYLSPPFM
ncbi:MAG: hypothetical protein ACLPR9_19430 [Acidimicrobiales bacterium]